MVNSDISVGRRIYAFINMIHNKVNEVKISLQNIFKLTSNNKNTSSKRVTYITSLIKASLSSSDVNV